MPALSPTMSQGNLVAWLVKEGQAIAPGDVLAEVETDKATMTWENQDDGFVAKLLVPEGTPNIDVGTPVAVLVEEEADVSAFKDYQPSTGAAAAPAPPPPPKTGAAEPAPAATGGDTAWRQRLGPAARMLLDKAGLKPEDVPGTGPHGILTKGDVLAAIAGGAQPKSSASAAAASAPEAAPLAQTKEEPAQASQAPAQTKQAGDRLRRRARGQYTDVPNSQMRKIIAKRLLESKAGTPHLYVAADVDMAGVASLRAALKSQGLKVSVNDCVVKAAAAALAAVPAANAHWDEAEGAAVPSSGVDISIAVATEKGLITPIVRGADAKPLPAIAGEVRDLAGRARANKLKPDEFQGGSFSISNLGMFGVDSFSAIINPPQACIMAVGGSRDVTVMQDGQLAVKSVMTVTLSADHRVYDGETASAFLAAFKSNMEAPFKLLL